MLFRSESPDGEGRCLPDLLGDRPFRVFIHSPKGLYAWECLFSREEAGCYLDFLLRDFLREDRFDYLPLKVILKYQLYTLYCSGEEKPGGDSDERFLEEVRECLEEETETQEVLSLMTFELPEDLRSKTRERYRPLFRFVGVKSAREGLQS